MEETSLLAPALDPNPQTAVSVQALLQALLLQNNPDILRKQEEEMMRKRKEREKAEEAAKRREIEAKAAKEVGLFVQMLPWKVTLRTLRYAALESNH